jgi:hypothetical protein
MIFSLYVRKSKATHEKKHLAIGRLPDGFCFDKTQNRSIRNQESGEIGFLFLTPK